MNHSDYKTEKPLLLMALLIVISSYAILLASPSSFREVWVTEDGPIEWLTVAVLFLLFTLSLHHWYLFRKQELLKPQAFYLLCAAAMLFALGEEISWGQRLLNFSTPEFFLQHNAQQEANLHNLKVFGVKLNKALFAKGSLVGAIFYLLLLPYLYRNSERVHQWVKDFSVPLASKKQILFILMIVIAIELMPSSKKGEVLECVGIIMLFAIFMNPYNKIFDAKLKSS